MHAKTEWQGMRSTAGIKVGATASVRLTAHGAVDLVCCGHMEKDGAPHAMFRVCEGVVAIPKPELVGFWKRTAIEGAGA